MQQSGSLAGVFTSLYACARAKGCDRHIAKLLLQTLRRHWVFHSVFRWQKRDHQGRRYRAYRLIVHPYGMVLHVAHLGALWLNTPIDQATTWLLWSEIMRPYDLHRELKKTASK